VACRVLIQRPDQKLRKVGRLEGVLGSLPDRQDQGYGIQVQPAGHERQSVAGRAVHPVRVVDDEQQGSWLRRLDQKVQGGQGDEKAIRCRAIYQPEGRFQRGALRRRQGLQLRQQRLEKLMQARKRQVRLRLHATDVQSPHAQSRRVPASLRHQRRLPYASLPADNESTAAVWRTLNELVECVQFPGSPVQPYEIVIIAEPRGAHHPILVRALLNWQTPAEGPVS
jgi:hypothetical protein